MLIVHGNKKTYGKYKIKENVLVPIRKKWGKAATTFQLLLGKIKKCYKNVLYKEKIVKKGDGNCQFVWVSTEVAEIGVFQSATTLSCCVVFDRKQSDKSLKPCRCAMGTMYSRNGYRWNILSLIDA